MKHEKTNSNKLQNWQWSLFNLRFHVEDVPHGHVGLPVAVSLTNQLLFGPGHMDPVRRWRGFVVQSGMGLSVPVMNQLSLKEQDILRLQQKTPLMFTENAVDSRLARPR